MPYGLSCYGTRRNSPACKLAGGGSVSIKERVTLVAGGQLAIVSPSARSTVKTSSILLPFADDYSEEKKLNNKPDMTGAG